MTTLHRASTFIAAGFGSGWLPKAPGTWGSITALIPAWAIAEGFSAVHLFIASAVLTTIGCVVCAIVLPQLESDDPGWIVIDEWAGQWLCIAGVMWFTPMGLELLLWSFVMFRLFDIIKPWPVSWLERTGPAWWSIMADDLGAGILGAGSAIAMIWMTGEVF